MKVRKWLVYLHLACNVGRQHWIKIVHVDGKAVPDADTGRRKRQGGVGGKGKRKFHFALGEMFASFVETLIRWSFKADRQYVSLLRISFRSDTLSYQAL